MQVFPVDNTADIYDEKKITKLTKKSEIQAYNIGITAGRPSVRLININENNV